MGRPILYLIYGFKKLKTRITFFFVTLPFEFVDHTFWYLRVSFKIKFINDIHFAVVVNI